MQRDPVDLLLNGPEQPKRKPSVPAPRPTCIPPPKKPFFWAEHGVFILPRKR